MGKKILLWGLLFLFFSSYQQLLSQNILIPKGAVWKYLDNGSDQGTAWTEIDYDDSDWASGPAQLGYGDGDESTKVSYGLKASNKYITTYFRHSFEVVDLSNISSIIVKLLRDDGGVVYLNGNEIARSNMPSGTITYTTLAASTVSGSEEDIFHEFNIEPSSLNIGENVVAVEIHQRSPSSSDISFDFELEGSTSSLSITRKAPYLIYTGNYTEYQIQWQLRNTLECNIAWGRTSSYSDGNTTTTEYGDDHQHSFTFQDLIPSTKYYYKVTVDSQEYRGSFYSAPAEDANEVKFLVYGDNRTYPEDHDKVAEQIIALFENDPGYQSIIMNVGDLVGSGDSEESWDNHFFNPKYTNIQKLLASMGMEITRGNHEGTGVLLKKYFPYPYDSSFYWSFDYGPAHIIILDQYIPYNKGTKEYDWLKSDLETTDKKWKFIVLHSPGWSAGGGHENTTLVQTEIQPLCEEYNVQIVFGGHNHYYARAEVNGVMHITTGGGGAPLYAPDLSYPNIVTASQSHHFCRINITGDDLDFKAINSDGNEIDAFTLTVTGIENEWNENIPSVFSLSHNYPNPFNPSTVISFTIPESHFVNLVVYNLLGEKVQTLVNKELAAGKYNISFDAKKLNSGVYLYSIKAGSYRKTMKMILMK